MQMEKCINKPACVLGIVNNTAGLQISEQMIQWLEPIYNIIKVYHDGDKYEYPALKKVQEIVIETKSPVLYLHTRGAFNIHKTTKPTHKMWKDQFGYNWNKYFELVNTDIPTVACPFTGNKKITWYNGFVANYGAMKNIPTIEMFKDRMKYERLFTDTNVEVIGVLTNSNDNDKEDSVIAAREYLFKNYK